MKEHAHGSKQQHQVLNMEALDCELDVLTIVPLCPNLREYVMFLEVRRTGEMHTVLVL